MPGLPNLPRIPSSPSRCRASQPVHHAAAYPARSVTLPRIPDVRYARILRPRPARGIYIPCPAPISRPKKFPPRVRHVGRGALLSRFPRHREGAGSCAASRAPAASVSGRSDRASHHGKACKAGSDSSDNIRTPGNPPPAKRDAPQWPVFPGHSVRSSGRYRPLIPGIAAEVCGILGLRLCSQSS